MRKMLDVGQVAQRCGVSVETIRRDIRSGVLPAFDFGKGRRATYRVEEPAVEDYLSTLKVRHRRSAFAPGSTTREGGLRDELSTREVG